MLTAIMMVLAYLIVIIGEADTPTFRGRLPQSTGEPATLTILSTAQHNHSTLQCLANVREDISKLMSDNATLTVQRELVTFCACL